MTETTVHHRTESGDDSEVGTRRHLLMLLAEGRLPEVLDIARASVPDMDPMAVVLQHIAVELVAVSSTAEQETLPTLRSLGALVAGLFNLDQREDAGDVLHDLNAAGKRQRAAFLGA